MSLPNSHPLSNSGMPASSGFSSQSQMGLPEVLQMCCLSRRSGQITFRSGESYGFIYIQHGRVLHSMCGMLEGEEAIYQMLTWPGGGFSLDEDILPHKKTVALTWEQLLFEGARRADGGMSGSIQPIDIPVTTAEPVISSRAKDSQPKLTITQPDQPPTVFELEAEYTCVGRVPGNEIILPYPSISKRHCIFVLSGPDIVLRDLNSSNGTVINGEAITEVILRPGDLIQVGVVQIKFDPGIRRPKLQNPITPPAVTELPAQLPDDIRSLTRNTAKLPLARARSVPQQVQVKDDSVYVKGESAINYADLAKPEFKKKKWVSLYIVGWVVLFCVVVGGLYYIFAFHH